MSFKNVTIGLLALAFVLALSAIIGWFDFRFLHGAVNQYRSSSFRSVEGVMVRCAVTERVADEGTVSDLDVEYTYPVGNQTYTGHRLRYLKLWSSSWVDRFAEEHPPLSPITVYYDQDNPAHAVLLPGMDGLELFYAMFLLPFNLILLGVLGAGVIHLLRRNSRLYPFGVHIVDGTDRVRIRLPNDSAIQAVAAALAVPVACVVFIGFCCGVPPAVPVMAAAWILVLVASAGAALQISCFLTTGEFDLVIDFNDKTMTLPVTFGRIGRVVISMAQLAAVDVITAKRKIDAGGEIMYLPIVRWRGADGALREDKLAEWSERQKADLLAAWLRARLSLETRPAGTP